MTFSNTAVRILLAWAALAVIQITVGMLVPLKSPSGGNIFAWMLLANLLVVAVLGFAALRSHWRGWPLAAALFAISFGIAFVDMIEGAMFLSRSGIDWRMLLIWKCCNFSAGIW